MDESKPPILPSELRRWSASERTDAAIDPAPATSANPGEFNLTERQSRSGQVEVRQNDPPDGSSVAVYYRNEAEVREGFLIALSALGLAVIEPIPESKKPIKSARP